MSKSIAGRIPVVAASVLILCLAFSKDEAVRVQFLGTGHPDIFVEKPRMQSAILVDVAGDRWLLDAGAGAVARLHDHRKAPETVDHLFVSHLHFDHYLDLDAFLWLWRTGSGSLRGPSANTLTAATRHYTRRGSWSNGGFVVWRAGGKKWVRNGLNGFGEILKLLKQKEKMGSFCQNKVLGPPGPGAWPRWPF